MAELTQLLQQVQAGDMSARDALFAATYPTLEMRARARLRDGGRNTLLDTRGVVHESYLRYVQGGTLRAEDRRAFFAFVSTAEVAHLHYSEQEIAETLDVAKRTVPFLDNIRRLPEFEQFMSAMKAEYDQLRNEFY